MVGVRERRAGQCTGGRGLCLGAGPGEGKLGVRLEWGQWAGPVNRGGVVRIGGEAYPALP